MSIANLSEQAWEVLHIYLAVHHRARLYLTGDIRLQRSVVLSRRAEDLVRRAYSWLAHPMTPLVCDTLLPFAREAVVHECHLKKSRVLQGRAGDVPCRLASIKCLGPDRRLNVNRPIDLRGLQSLQRLKFMSGPRSTLLLPSSLTQLSAAAARVEKFVNFHELVNLRVLEISMLRSEVLRFGSGEAAWPPHLTSLKLTVTMSDYPFAPPAATDTVEGALECVPSSLLRLCVRDTRPLPWSVDVFPPPHCVCLESYELRGRGECKREGGLFPASLRNLVLDTLRVHSATDAIFGALAASSLTRFSVTTVEEDTQGGYPAQWYDALMPILARIDLEGLERLAADAFAGYSSLHNNRAILDLFEQAFSRIGCKGRHFDLVRKARCNVWEMPALTEACDFDQVRRFVRRKAIMNSLQRDRHEFLLDNFEWSIKMGLLTSASTRDVLRYSDRLAEVAGTAATPGHTQPQPPLVLSGIVRFSTNCNWPQTMPDWNHVFGDYRYPDLALIEVPSWDYGSVIAAVSRHRANMPSLDAIRFLQRPTLRAEEVQVLNAMGLHDLGAAGVYRYRVAARPSREDQEQ